MVLRAWSDRHNRFELTSGRHQVVVYSTGCFPNVNNKALSDDKHKLSEILIQQRFLTLPCTISVLTGQYSEVKIRN